MNADMTRQVAADTTEAAVAAAREILTAAHLASYRTGEEVGAELDYIVRQLDAVVSRIYNGTPGQPMTMVNGFMRPVSK